MSTLFAFFSDGFYIPLSHAGVDFCRIYVDLLAKSDILQQERNVPSKCQEKGECRPIIKVQVERKRTAPVFLYKLSDVTTG